MTLMTFLLDVLIIFVFVLWFWLLITVMSDLFRRDDVGGFRRVAWLVFLVVLPYLGVFAYLLAQGGKMAERNVAHAAQARDELRHIVGYSIADELKKLEELKASNAISPEEYARLRARAIA